MAFQEQNVVRLHVAMLNLLAVQEIQRLGRLLKIRNQLLQRDSVVPFLAAFLKPAAQAAIRQLHDDIKAFFRHGKRLCLQQERVTDILNYLEGFEFPLGGLVMNGPCQHLDSTRDSARSQRAPHLTETSAAYALEQTVLSGHAEHSTDAARCAR